jgi:lipoprotein-releasing system permease protein
MKEGQSKLPNIRRFKIVGIFNSDFKNRCDIRIRDTCNAINKWKADQVGAFEVFVDDFDNIKTVGKKSISTLQDRCLTLKRSSKNTVIYLSFNYSISILLLY